ncbi:type VII toxin-antitoxin system MntA family adenylyltransferase antitoxin [Hydrogenispora ethanolica]|nr:nucleotidyltransferase domain-containing protein [Hydrogenispora ethanolica]
MVSFLPPSISDVAARYGLRFLVYFGSYGTEYYHRESDIDLAFLAEADLSPEQCYQLLEELILVHRKSEIDLVDLKTADPVLRNEVARDGRVLYEQEPGLFERYALFYIKRYYELRPILAEEMRRIGQHIREVLGNEG